MSLKKVRGGGKFYRSGSMKKRWNGIVRVCVVVLVVVMCGYAQCVGPKGLANCGATCYLNSVTQNLFNVPAFVDAIASMPDIVVPDIEAESVKINNFLKQNKYVEGVSELDKLAKQPPIVLKAVINRLEIFYLSDLVDKIIAGTDKKSELYKILGPIKVDLASTGSWVFKESHSDMMRHLCVDILGKNKSSWETDCWKQEKNLTIEVLKVAADYKNDSDMSEPDIYKKLAAKLETGNGDADWKNDPKGFLITFLSAMRRDFLEYLIVISKVGTVKVALRGAEQSVILSRATIDKDFALFNLWKPLKTLMKDLRDTNDANNFAGQMAGVRNALVAAGVVQMNQQEDAAYPLQAFVSSGALNSIFSNFFVLKRQGAEPEISLALNLTYFDNDSIEQPFKSFDEVLKNGFLGRGLEKVSPYAILYMKRLSGTTQYDVTKIDDPFEIPRWLDFSKYTTLSPSLKLEDAQFVLIGAACHNGTAQGGHWIAYVCDQRAVDVSKCTWYHCSDMAVAPVDQNDVTMWEDIKENGVLLFYRKATPQELVPFNKEKEKALFEKLSRSLRHIATGA